MGLDLGRVARTWLLAALCACVPLAFAQAASADTYCVHLASDASCAGAQHETPDLEDALADAQPSANADDTVVIRSGEFTAPNAAGFPYTGDATNTVTIVGAGRTHTTLTAPDTLTSSVLSLDHGTVSALRVVVPKANSRTGIALDDSTADDVAVQNTPFTSGPTGVRMAGDSTLTRARIAVRFAGEASGVETDSPTAIVDRSTVEATVPVLFAGGQGAIVQRSHLIGAVGVGATAGGGVVRDSLIEASGRSALVADPGGATDVANITARNVTAVNTGAFGGSIGAISDASTGFSEVDFFDSVMLGYETSGSKFGTNPVLQGQHYASDAPNNGDSKSPL